MNKPIFFMVLLYVLGGISGCVAGFLVNIAIGLLVLSLFLVIPAIVLYNELRESEQ